MKKIIFCFVTLYFGFFANTQILTNSLPAPAISQSNAFLDASSNFSSIAGESNNLHKGIVFPDVNLTTFEFENIIADGITLPSYYDGMIVYNTATGNTLTTGVNPNVSSTVVPGFYYFSNPNGATNGNVTGGVWKALGSSASSSNSVFRVTTSSYSILNTDNTLLVDVPSGGTTLFLPPASANNGKIFTIVKTDNDNDILTFDQAIISEATSNFNTLNFATTLRIQSDGTNWLLIY